MEVSRLLEKSQENEAATDLLAEAGKFHAATSRAYYAVYQKIIYILECNGKEVTRVHGRNISELRNLPKKEGSQKELKKAIRAAKVLKRFRKDCDYSKVTLMDSLKYETEISVLAQTAHHILNNYQDNQ